MSNSPPPRERIALDRGWRFAFGHARDPAKDFGHATGYFTHLAKAGYGDGAAHSEFDDRAWRELELPHDWAVELPFASNGSHSHGYKALGHLFPETSVGWYRRRVFVPEADLGRRISLEFEGVFRDSQLFVNGFCLGREPSGYLGFRYDISDYLNYGGDNCIAMRVDASAEEGWFYEGAGIYRPVWLIKTAPLHIAADGICVTTTLEDGAARARVNARASVSNQGTQAISFEVKFSILDAQQQERASGAALERELLPGEVADLEASLSLAEPKLWSLKAPTLYTLVTRVVCQGTVVDQLQTPFGIRTLRFDADHGFFLNGEHVRLLGSNNHQDHAGVGTALPEALQEFRILTLKSMGSNAYRCAHHPPTPALLDACDRLGMLVIDEARLMGSSPSELAQVERMIARDRNHPSVILWSLGNEEWAIEGNVKGARIASTMLALAKRLDPTRRLTIAISGGWGNGISAVVDVMGYNYIGHGSTDRQHAEFPQQPGVGTEETTTQGTRGVYVTDAAKAHSAPVANGTSGGNAEIGWKHYAARPYLAGLFYWTGFDYRGESNPFGFPAISSQFGILDSCGFPKDGYYYLKSWWDEQPVLHVFPHWNWPGREGEPVEVWAFSNADEVELWLNGQSLGRKAVERNGHVEWQVPYHPGELVAQSYRNQVAAERLRIETTTAPHALELSAARGEIRADGRDVAMVRVSTRDAHGRAVPTAENAVTFAVSGPGRIIGVGNGDPSSHEPDRYLADLHAIDVQGFKELALGAGGHGEREVALGFDDSSWPPAFAAAEADEPVPRLRVFRARFERPALPRGASVRLLLRHFGDEQTVYLNGKRVATFGQGAKNELPELALHDEFFPTGPVELSVVASPYRDQRARESAERGAPARLRIDGPAPTWRRKLFNGLAQVILQSTGEPGAITLVATSPGLDQATLTLRSA